MPTLLLPFLDFHLARSEIYKSPILSLSDSFLGYPLTVESLLTLPEPHIEPTMTKRRLEASLERAVPRKKRIMQDTPQQVEALSNKVSPLLRPDILDSLRSTCCQLWFLSTRTLRSMVRSIPSCHCQFNGSSVPQHRQSSIRACFCLTRLTLDRSYKTVPWRLSRVH
jgi:hypothetical protein